MAVEALIAAVRFGLGPRPGELASAGTDPRGAVKAQVRAPVVPPPPRDVAPTAALVANLLKAIRNADEATVLSYLKGEARQIYLAEIRAQMARAVNTDTPFHERLVLFWTNHFTVSAHKPAVTGLVGAFQREAIAPHVTGRFVDLLKAATRHPAMLLYLDQAGSFGPNSLAGRRRDKGLNENLAREILELHTLGVDGGYDQADVGALARILTGWTVNPTGKGDASFFEPKIHEPGDQRLLGTTIREAAVGQGDEAMALLAHHPATASHLATKLVRHFVADDPPAEAVAAIAKVFRDSGGDLEAVSLALVDLDQPWQAPLTKVKSPSDLVISIYRLIGLVPEPEVAVGAMKLLGQQPFTAPSPKGWPDTGREWLSPDSLMRRIELAQKVGARLATVGDGNALLVQALGAAAPPEVADAVRRAGDRASGIALVLASPQFLRR